MIEPSLAIAVWLAVGLVAGAAFAAYVRSVGRARGKVLANGLVIAALIYVGFALWRGTAAWIVAELVGVALFAVFAWLGIRRSVAWLAVGWSLHTVWDAALHLGSTGGAFAPEWYVVACISFDLLLAAMILMRRGEH